LRSVSPAKVRADGHQFWPARPKGAPHAWNFLWRPAAGDVYLMMMKAAVSICSGVDRVDLHAALRFLGSYSDSGSVNVIT
jgi:hypothetical protein